MTVIMCTKRLWKELGQAGSPEKLPASVTSNEARLGDWGATVVFAGHDAPLVLALNGRTLLAALCPVLRPHRVAMHIAESTRRQLVQFGVSEEAAEREAGAILEADFGATRDRSLTGHLNDLSYHAELIMERGAASLEDIEAHLTDTPHVKREPAYPEDAIKLLFDV